MAKLQGFRLVNVHANHNRIIYPNECFFVDGKNALLDMKNGGGKTLAAQMLFQTILPNSYFSDKNQVVNLFAGVTGGSTVHTVSHFSIEGHQFNNLYLGFAAMAEPRNSDDNLDSVDSTDLGLKYMNYVIAGNNLETDSLSMDTLPLCKNEGESITPLSYKNLKEFLQGKMKSEKHGRFFYIQIFENEKGKYYQELKRFGINSEVFEFLREINKDENFIKQFFEEKCRKPKDLLMNFIVPNTEKALDSRAFVMKLEKVDRSGQLAESLFEKSQSLNELNKFQADKAEYERLRDEISTFIEFVNGKVHILEAYDTHLSEYPKQVAVYTFALRQMEELHRYHEAEGIRLEEKKGILDKELENIGIRKIQIELENLEKIFLQKKNLLNQLTDEIDEKNYERIRLEAINLVIDYKQHESDKIGIDERLEKLTSENYDEKRVASELANTICKLAENEKSNLEIERKGHEERRDENERVLGHLKKAEGRLENQIDQCKSSLLKLNDQKYEAEREWADIEKDISTFPHYSNSLFDEDELATLEELKVSMEEELSEVKEAISKNNTDQIATGKDKENTESIIWEREKNLKEKTDWIDEYEASLQEVKLKTTASESNIIESSEQLRSQIEQLIRNEAYINEMIENLKSEISILEDYGFLRTRSKYDALNSVIGDWKFARFGSDLLREMEEDKAIRILDRFPGFAEVVIVPDEDYSRVSMGKKIVSVTVAKENFVIMPWSVINRIDDSMQFESMYLLTRNGEYYKNLLNPKEAINDRKNEVSKLSVKLKMLGEEKQIIESQIELMSMHVHKYPKKLTAKYFDEVKKLENAISDLKAQKLRQEQLIRELELKVEKLKNQQKQLEQEKIEVFEKHKLLSEKMFLDETLKKITVQLKGIIEEKAEVEYDLDNNQADISKAQKEKKQFAEILARVNENIRKYNEYIRDAEGYKDDRFDFVDIEDITNMYSKFLAAKRSFDIKVQNYEDLVEQQRKLDNYMKGIRDDHRFSKVEFTEIYGLNNVKKISSKEFELLEMKIKELTDKKGHLEEEKSTAEAEVISCRNNYKKQEEKITVYFEKFQAMDSFELSGLERECKVAVLKIIDQQNANKRSIIEVEDKQRNDDSELKQYKVFCDTNFLKWQTAKQADIKYSYEDMHRSYAIVKVDYDKAIGKINTEIKKLDITIQKLSVSEQLKSKLKEYLNNKQSFNETTQLIKLLNQTADIIRSTIRNLETSIDNIGRLDEEIAEQVFRMLKTILDEIAKIPEYSKFKYGEYTKESFRINLSDENSCRIENDIALSRLKAYVYELANSVQNEGMTKKDIKNRLSINNIMQYGIDFEKLNIQILKIEQEKPKYYRWGQLSASSGQSYVTYVMFAITMIKYFNNVTIISDKMKAPIFIFLDNPFASASSIELWEPVRRFLDKSNAQLLCVAHNVPSSAQILFDKHMIIEQTKNEKGQFINTIRNEKTESKEIIQMQLFDHMEID
ncbi:MAG: hypothetical protein CVV02_02140 [Firmicutes bacterium HGW-Firmicutes-7]|nr:MAG: hypothetical protein CVV02_02140 [Firmicutes bacterium HGW-Firmicutes-7]